MPQNINAPITDTLGLAVGINPSETVLPTQMLNVLVESIDRFGGTPGFTPDTSISPARQNFKGIQTSNTAGVEITTNLKLSLWHYLTEAFLYSTMKNKAAVGVGINNFTTGAGITRQAGNFNADETAVLGSNSLIVVQGAANPSNNGVKRIATGPNTNSGALSLMDPVVTESMTNAKIYPGGYYTTAATANSITGTYTSGSNMLNLTIPGIGAEPTIYEGQTICIGSFNDTTGDVDNALTAMVNSTATANAGHGRCRVVRKLTNNLILDKLDEDLQRDVTLPINESLYLRYGTFIKNVWRTDPDFNELWLTWERAIHNIGSTGGDFYRYIYQNRPGDWSINISPETIIQTSYLLEARDASLEIPSAERMTPVPLDQDLISNFSSQGHVGRIAFDRGVDTLDMIVLDATITLSNLVGRTPAPGFINTRFLPFGNITPTVAMVATYSDEHVYEYVRKNQDMSWGMTALNEEGSVHIDIPAATLAPDQEGNPRGEQITLPGTLNGHMHPIFKSSIMISNGYGDIPIAYNEDRGY